MGNWAHGSHKKYSCNKSIPGTITAYLHLMKPLSCVLPHVRPAIFCLVIGLVSTPLAAATLFNFRDTATGPGHDLDGLASGTATVETVTVTMTLFPDGVFNQTVSAFGINAAAGTDDTDEFDAGEGFTFSFNHNVTLDSVAVSSFGSGNSGRISYDGGSVIGTITGTGTTILDSSVITSGTVLRFESLVGAFSLDSLTVTAMPEPDTVPLLSGAGALGLALLHRFRSRRVKTNRHPAA